MTENRRHLAGKTAFSFLIIFGGPAAAQVDIDLGQTKNPALQLMLCRSIKDDLARLKCFDESLEAFSKPAPKQTSTESSEIEKGWNFQGSRSPIDESFQVTASLFADERQKGSLSFQCKERRIEGFFTTEKFIGTSLSGRARAIYRINDDKPVEVRWNVSSDGKSVVFNNAAAFMQSLPDDAKLFVRVQGVPVDATFSLGKISEARARILTACTPTQPPKPVQKSKG